MDLVVDANVLFSSLIKEGITAELLFAEDLRLFTPEFIMEEFQKYEKEILKKTSRTKEQFIQIFHALQEVITIVPREEFEKYIKIAYEICPDEKDIMYFALALKLNCAIWSNDKKLKEQDRIKIYSTQDLCVLF